MKKWKATTLLTIVLVITAILTVVSFARFPVGTKDFNGFLGAIETEYDLSGGTAYTLTLDKDNVEDVENVKEVINTLKARLNLLGYENYSVKAIKDVDEAVKDYDIRIETRGKVNKYGEIDKSALAQDMAVVAAYGELKFFGGTSANPTEEILTSGSVISDAYYAGLSSDGNSYQVAIKFTDYAYSEIIKQIRDNSSYYLEIKLGDNVLLSGSNALAESYFNDKTIAITSSSDTSARQFALQMKSGGLAYKYNVSDGQDVSSPLGENLGTKSVIALGVLVLAVIAAMFVFDKKYGIVSCLSMILFTDLYLAMLVAIPNIKVSFGGIIGVALAILLVADGLFITSKRIKEEFARGKTVKSSVRTGYKRSILPIAGATGIATVLALTLLAFAGGAVKNFAIIFLIGAALSLVTTMLIARMFTSLILPLAEYKESFFGVKRTENANAETAENRGE